MKKGIVQLAGMVAAGIVLLALGHRVLGTIPLVLAAVLAVLAFVAPAVVETLERVAARAGRHVGNALGAVVLTIVYGIVFVPGALALRFRGRDPLDRRFPTGGRTNWIARGEPFAPALYAKQYTPPHGGRA